MAGFISGFDGQTPDDIVAAAARLNDIGVDVPFLSIRLPSGVPRSITNTSPQAGFSWIAIGGITTAIMWP